MSDFYKRLDEVEQENRLKRIFKDRPENLHEYQGCAKDTAESLPPQPENPRLTAFREYRAAKSESAEPLPVEDKEKICEHVPAGEVWNCDICLPQVEPKPTLSTPSEPIRDLANPSNYSPQVLKDRLAAAEKLACGSPFEREQKPRGVMTELTDRQLLERGVRGCRDRSSRKGVKHPRWVAVAETFALGSTYSHELCRVFGLDPDEEVTR